ncbi:MAG: hypothetical protein JNL60_18905 [Bacteroidia bacterium]|nr:hypothetical protein [Bacteroidia bacterium]
MRSQNNKHFTVAGAISHLLAKGYTADFEACENGVCVVPREHSFNRSPDDFFIDEIFRCEEGEGEEHEVIYVFAVSSRKYGLKGIVTNILKEEDPENISFIQKMKLAFLGFREYLLKN